MAWNPGDHVVWRSRPGGAVGYVLAAVVVSDTVEVTVLFQPEGAPGKRRARERGGPRGRSMVAGGWNGGHEDVTWRGPSVVRLHPAGCAFSVIREWHPAGNGFHGWYVNLEQPWGRTPIGFDSLDHVLDITVADDLSSWSWKDEDELAWAIEVGEVSAEDAGRIRAEGERVAEMIEAGHLPFGNDWSSWAPAASWSVPSLPPDWDSPF